MLMFSLLAQHVGNQRIICLGLAFNRHHVTAALIV